MATGFFQYRWFDFAKWVAVSLSDERAIERFKVDARRSEVSPWYIEWHTQPGADHE